MGHFTVLYDANVLYPAPLRDILIQLATTRLYRAKWSNRIHEEWIRNVLKNRSDISREQLERIKKLMDSSVLDCLVENYEDIEGGLQLPDSNDKHILAAAIVSSCDVIVTFNIKDFPSEELDKYAIETQHPDDFLMHLTNLDLGKFCVAIKTTRMRLKNPPKNITEYLEILSNQGLTKTVLFLEDHRSLL
ncbi:PIN domain-containing protein [Legionella taurinensis]|uniref:PIN domain-containing protein n=1 Tax=Legionella taurinensis TaxID=70611 RepID=A0A3A5L753_9GAMM|nr:PIN domain-containing protein [Legionella taurinensis]MDX1837730.1 PIN domain-containing protein [Legionella taurinensis]PUT40011.1 PIN domain-containing protein [Legionella taurinensis]PUT43777.1 PIN domain-containing protein [Legionella taurinensis]PUT46090.1 PIN domain-containing protein [Legionella taurinensis]PUT47932.1 PIN domain-containing protein [Legionella taurinensis]